jgi:hypothetical protein
LLHQTLNSWLVALLFLQKVTLRLELGRWLWYVHGNTQWFTWSLTSFQRDAVHIQILYYSHVHS